MTRRIIAIVLPVVLLAGLAACGGPPGGWPGQSQRGAQPPVSAGPIPTPPSAPVPAVGLPSYQAGMNILFYQSMGEAHALIPRLLRRLRADQVNSVSIVFPIYEDSPASTTVSVGSDTPPDAGIAYTIRAAHLYGMAVTLRPLMDESKLRGARSQLHPANLVEWFKSYTRLMSHYARLSQIEGVEALNIGGELDSLEPYTDKWLQLIKDVRSAYDGKLIYSVQGGTLTDPSGVNRVQFWPQLDFIGIDAYPPIPGEVHQGWDLYMSRVADEATQMGRPLILTEVGELAAKDAHLHPYAWEADGAPDFQEQANYYRAICAAAKPLSAGIYWWYTPLDPEESLRAKPSDFSPIGKPAELAVKRCKR